VTRRKRPGFNLGSRRCGAAAFRRALRAEAHQARRLPRTAPQVTGRLRSPPVSCCRARQHHGQAVSIALSESVAGKVSQPTSRNAAHCPDWPLQRQGHPKIVSNRSAETIFRTHP
jgi:hypothetical protein